MRPTKLFALLIGLTGFVLSLGAQSPASPADLARADINDDQVVDNADLTLVRATYGKRQGQLGYNPLADMDGNNVITIADLTFVQRHLRRRVPPSVHINEVDSNPADFIEFINTGTTPADLSGWSIRDNDDSHIYVMPANTVIAPGGYLVVEDPPLGFGLGAADSVRLFDESGYPFASHSWTAHAATSYGRCPNGTGNFVTTTTVTKGGANDCNSPVKINEVESSALPAGNDWLELYNPSSFPADVSGFIFRDNDNTHAGVIPANTVIAPGAYLVLEENVNFSFGLGAGDNARLFDASGVLLDTYAWTAHATVTYGRCPNGTGGFADTFAATKGTANTCTAPVTTVHINEIESNPSPDWVELVNTGATPADLSGWSIRDNDDTHIYVFPAGSTIAGGGFLVVEEDALTYGLGAADSVRLFNASGVLFEQYDWTAHAATTYGRCPNGTGSFVIMTTATKGAANSCASPVKINEIESNTTPATPDWVELYNPSASAVDISGFKFVDGDITHTPYVLPAGSVIPAGGYFVLEEIAHFQFGLGSADTAQFLDAASGVIDSHSWTAHAATTYGRCPSGTGAFTTTTASTKGAVNDCGAAPIEVKINEIESSGGTGQPDWIELFNPAATSADLSGAVLKDSNETPFYTFPAGTTLAAGAYLVVEEPLLPFGLGSGDSVRFFGPTGAVLDSHSWTAHATTTYGRCPNGTGPFTTTQLPTKGTVNSCPGDPLPWPGSADVTTVDSLNVLGGNMSGLVYERLEGANPVNVLWAVKNGPGTLFRLLWDGVSTWISDTANDWSAGKALKYPNGTGNPDSEGVTFAGTGSAGGIYVATERNNDVSGTSKNSILRFAPAAAGTTLSATNEWDVTALLPAVGSNLGMEAITWIPDSFLQANGFIDDAAGGAVYNPATYPNHGDGLFFVGLEFDGSIHAFALNHANNSAIRVTTFASTMTGVMDLLFDRELEQLWAVCDDTCQGRSTVFTMTAGRFTVKQALARPANAPNLNNEGFAFPPLAECVANQRPVFWADDANTGGHAIRRGTVTCVPF